MFIILNNNMINLTDLPNDILLLIFSMVEGEITANRFIRISKNLKISIKPHKHIRTTDLMYKHYCMTNPYSCILPHSISKLEQVCKVFSEVSKQLWETIFIQHIRNGKPYKHPNKHNYKKKYFSKIIPYYKEIMEFHYNDREFSRNMFHIKSNNAYVYMKCIQRAIENEFIDNPERRYDVDGLLGNEQTLRVTWSLNLNFEGMVQCRRKAVLEKDIYKRRSQVAHQYHKIYEKIYKSLKNY